VEVRKDGRWSPFLLYQAFKTNYLHVKEPMVVDQLFQSLKRSLILFLLFIGSGSLFATHIVGGDLTYTCLGGDNYKIRLVLYGDCAPGNAILPFNGTLQVYDSLGVFQFNQLASFDSLQYVDPYVNDTCLQLPYNKCIESAVLTDTLYLPQMPGGYEIVYSACCRSYSVTNVVPNGVAYMVEINSLTMSGCNNSSVFINDPAIIFCLNDTLSYDHSATDVDGDSIVYSLCDPLEAYNVPVNYYNGYSTSYQIDASPAFAIDPITGILTGKPIKLGEYVLGVCAMEYRNGVYLSTNRREFQYEIVLCDSIGCNYFPKPSCTIISKKDQSCFNVCQGEIVVTISSPVDPSNLFLSMKPTC